MLHWMQTVDAHRLTDIISLHLDVYRKEKTVPRLRQQSCCHPLSPQVQCCGVESEFVSKLLLNIEPGGSGGGGVGMLLLRSDIHGSTKNVPGVA